MPGTRDREKKGSPKEPGQIKGTNSASHSALKLQPEGTEVVEKCTTLFDTQKTGYTTGLRGKGPDRHIKNQEEKT